MAVALDSQLAKHIISIFAAHQVFSLIRIFKSFEGFFVGNSDWEGQAFPQLDLVIKQADGLGGR
jgi:amino acid permease